MLPINADPKEPNPPTRDPVPKNAPGEVGGGTSGATDVGVTIAENGTAIPLLWGTRRVDTNVLERTDPYKDGDNWQPLTSYRVNQTCINDNSKFYVCITGGYSNSVSGQGPKGTGQDIIDGSVHWRYVDYRVPGKFYATGRYYYNGAANQYALFKVTTTGVTATNNNGPGLLNTGTGIVDGTCRVDYVCPATWSPIYVHPYVVLGLCEGPVASVGTTWVDKTRIGGVPPGFTLVPGNQPQVVPAAHNGSYGTMTYPNLAVLSGLNVFTGSQAEHPAVSAEVKGVAFGAASADAQPALVIQDALTHSRRGLGWLGTRLDTNWSGAAGYATYCDAAGLRISPLVDGQTSGLSLITECLAATNSDGLWSGGKVKLVPRGDQSITAPVYGGVNYVPVNAPAYDLGVDDFLDAAQPVRIVRRSDSDCYNSCPVEYTDRGLDYQRVTVDHPDLEDIERKGLKRAATLSLPCLTSASQAVLISKTLVQRSLVCRNEYTFRVGWRFLLLDSTDAVTLTEPGIGLDHVAVRILTIDEEPDGLLIVAEDWPAGTGHAATYTTQANDGYRPNLSKTLATVAAQSAAPTPTSDSSLTRANFDNLWPNPTSESQPVAGADLTNPEWSDLFNAGGNAYAGSWVRQLVAPAAGVRVVVGLSGTGYSTDGLTWTTVASSVNPRAVCDNGSLFVGVAQGGPNQVWTSPDGITWTTCSGANDWDGTAYATYYSVAWNGYLFCAVGYNNHATSPRCMTSPDGINWTLRTIPGGSGSIYSKVVWAGGQFIAIGTNVCATSPDGSTWTTRIVPAGAWKDVEWNGATFCAVGTNVAATSPDGINWTSRTIPAGSYVALAWNGSVLYAIASDVGGVGATSPTGVTWTMHTPPAAALGYSDVLWDGTNFIAIPASSSTAYTSPDGIYWSAHTMSLTLMVNAAVRIPQVKRSLTVACVPGDTFFTDVAVRKVPGFTGGVTAVGVNVANAPDGVAFAVSTIPAGTYYAISRGAGILVAVGANVCATSLDGGYSWNSRTIPTGTYTAVAWNGSVFCAVGGSSPNCATSPDGITWTARTIPGTPTYYYGIAWNGSVFCAIGTTVLATSPDGINWTARTGAAGMAILWTGTKFVTISSGGTYSSPDGITWTAGTIPVGYYSAIAWNGSIFVAVGDNTGPTAISSTDGVTWTARTNQAGDFRSVVWNGSLFVAIDWSNKLSTSPDGITWTTQSALPATGPYYAAVEGQINTGGFGGVSIVFLDTNNIQVGPSYFATVSGTTWAKATTRVAQAPVGTVSTVISLFGYLGTWQFDSIFAGTAVSHKQIALQVGVSAYQAAAQSVPTGVTAAMKLDVLDYDTHGAVSYASGAWVFTCPAGLGGLYRVACGADIQTLPVGAIFDLYIYKNGLLYRRLGYYINYTAATVGFANVNGTIDLSLSPGDNITIGVHHGAPGSLSINNDAVNKQNFVTVHRILGSQ